MRIFGKKQNLNVGPNNSYVDKPCDISEVTSVIFLWHNNLNGRRKSGPNPKFQLDACRITKKKTDFINRS